jgi:AmiR/NasT family two-component response regulator
MAREDVDAVAAFNRLRGMARSTGSKVAEIANRLLGEFPGSPDRRV